VTSKGDFHDRQHGGRVAHHLGSTAPCRSLRQLQGRCPSERIRWIHLQLNTGAVGTRLLALQHASPPPDQVCQRPQTLLSSTMCKACTASHKGVEPSTDRIPARGPRAKNDITQFTLCRTCVFNCRAALHVCTHTLKAHSATILLIQLLADACSMTTKLCTTKKVAARTEPKHCLHRLLPT
jgi:hypothetical protein